MVPSDVLTAILSIDFDKNKDLFRGIMDGTSKKKKKRKKICA